MHASFIWFLRNMVDKDEKIEYSYASFIFFVVIQLLIFEDDKTPLFFHWKMERELLWLIDN